AELGLPAVSPHTAYIARDKFAMRTAFAEAGNVPQPDFGLARTLDEAKQHAQRVGYPLILKPIIGCHSMFVQKIADEAELEQHFPTIARGAWEGFTFDPLHAETQDKYEGGVLVEEFVPGTEISVESLIVDGVTHCIA